jgi:hypothetical protein
VDAEKLVRKLQENERKAQAGTLSPSNKGAASPASPVSPSKGKSDNIFGDYHAKQKASVGDVINEFKSKQRRGAIIN